MDGSFEVIISNIVSEETYDPAAALRLNDNAKKSSVFNAEYRIIQSKKRLDNALRSIGKDRYFNEIMGKLLVSANGVAAYNVAIEELFSKLKPSRAPQEPPDGEDLVPMTLIAYKVVTEQIVCSVERLFCQKELPNPSWENPGNYLYLPDIAAVAAKFTAAQYRPIGIIGRGDFAEPLRKVFVEQFGFRLR